MTDGGEANSTHWIRIHNWVMLCLSLRCNLRLVLKLSIDKLSLKRTEDTVYVRPFVEVSRTFTPVSRGAGLIHTGRETRRARKLEHFCFDVACVQCEYSH